ncbi:MAG: hypothetical protein EXS37_17465 [Opitutus sp.]|nr:hypothetical protein [Opitutus sp.]
MRSCNFLLVLSNLLAFVPAASATSVVAPSFSELVAEAQDIFRAKVREVRSAWVDSPQGRVIKTYVTFDVLKRLKGQAPAELTLQFLGGELDGESMRVAGMPRFSVGQTELVFVSGNGRRFCPLVAMMHGRYRVQTDSASGREYVARDDGVPLESEHDVPLPQAENGIVNRLKRVSAALAPDVSETSIAGATLTVNAARPIDAGSYSVVVTDGSGSGTSTAATLAVNFSRLTNLSTRGLVEEGDALTPGFSFGEIPRSSC